MPDDVLLRPPREEDIPRLLELAAEANRETGTDSVPTEEDLRANWSAPGFDLEQHARVAVLDGTVVGECHVFFDRPNVHVGGFVSAGDRGRGAGHRMLSWCVEQARTFDGAEAAFVFAATHIEDRVALIESFAGFEHVRSFYRMVNRDPGAVDAPEWPDGVRLVPMRGEELARAAKAAYDGSFVDHWNHHDSALELWLYELTTPHTDETLWHIAVGKDDEIAGLCLTGIDDRGSVLRGDLGPIGTTRAYRGIGLGRALLRHGLRVLAERGAQEVSLGVDTENPSGAVRLYETNGFERSFEAKIYRFGL